jgi:glycopeptide antibiotics resistance protein
MSFLLEVVQFALAVGRSDVTDLLMNTLGGAAGGAGFYLLFKLFGGHEQKTVLAVCCLLTLLELYMAASFLLFGQLHLGFMIVKLA